MPFDLSSSRSQPRTFFQRRDSDRHISHNSCPSQSYHPDLVGRLHASLPLRFDFIRRSLRVIRRNFRSVFELLLIFWSVLILHSKHLGKTSILAFYPDCSSTLLNLAEHPRLVRRKARDSRNVLQSYNDATSSSSNFSAALICFYPA